MDQMGISMNRSIHQEIIYPFEALFLVQHVTNIGDGMNGNFFREIKKSLEVYNFMYLKAFVMYSPPNSRV